MKKILAKNSKLGALVIGVITLSFLLISLTIFSQGVFAQGGLDTTAQEAGLASGETNIMKILGQIIYIILSLLGVVFIILVIYGGFMRMTAGGKSDQIEKSTKIITSAVIGVVIILASYAITAFVLSRVGASVGSGGLNTESVDYIQSGSCVKIIIDAGYSSTDCFDNETVDSCTQKCQNITGAQSLTCTWSGKTCAESGH